MSIFKLSQDEKWITNWGTTIKNVLGNKQTTTKALYLLYSFILLYSLFQRVWAPPSFHWAQIGPSSPSPDISPSDMRHIASLRTIRRHPPFWIGKSSLYCQLCLWLLFGKRLCKTGRRSHHSDDDIWQILDKLGIMSYWNCFQLLFFLYLRSSCLVPRTFHPCRAIF